MSMLASLRGLFLVIDCRSFGGTSSQVLSMSAVFFNYGIPSIEPAPLASYPLLTV